MSPLNSLLVDSLDTLGHANTEFDYDEQLALTRQILCIKIIDSNVKKVGYSNHTPYKEQVSFASFLLVVNRP